mmetsp:Transcript_40483/g.87347  ORF Transcript_40483/g.87347 Transcript_40483/m.87347 type:complete len:228 (+) Transcript_40483:285-968(+)
MFGGVAGRGYAAFSISGGHPGRGRKLLCYTGRRREGQRGRRRKAEASRGESIGMAAADQGSGWRRPGLMAACCCGSRCCHLETIPEGRCVGLEVEVEAKRGWACAPALLGKGGVDVEVDDLSREDQVAEVDVLTDCNDRIILAHARLGVVSLRAKEVAEGLLLPLLLQLLRLLRLEVANAVVAAAAAVRTRHHPLLLRRRCCLDCRRFGIIPGGGHSCGLGRRCGRY